MSSDQQTGAQSKATNIRIMGNELGSLYSELWQQLVWLHMKWAEYRELFGSKQSRITLLNEAAPFFFYVIQDVMWNDILLHICKLTDPPNSAGKSNLSVTRLPAAINDNVTSTEVQKLCDAAQTATGFCRDWRNRRISHLDLDLALGQPAQPLSPASRDDVTKALASLTQILDAVSIHYQNSTTAFSLTNTIRGAKSLLYVMDDGIKAENERRKELENGIFNQAKHQRLGL